MYDLNITNTTYSGIAGAAIPQFTAVSINSSGQYVASTAAANTDGIVQDKPSAQGATMVIAGSGFTKANIAASQTLVIGNLLDVGAGGNLVLHAAGTAVAKAMEALPSAAVVKTITVKLLASNAAY